jgi:hypothetical protein
MTSAHDYKKNHGEECETCDQHPWFAEMMTKIKTDLGWIKAIGYFLMIAAASIVASVWAIGYPTLISLNERMIKIETASVVHAEKLYQLDRITSESKQDRKDIHKSVDDLKGGK